MLTLSRHSVRESGFQLLTGTNQSSAFQVASPRRESSMWAVLHLWHNWKSQGVLIVNPHYARLFGMQAFSLRCNSYFCTLCTHVQLHVLQNASAEHCQVARFVNTMHVLVDMRSMFENVTLASCVQRFCPLDVLTYDTMPNCTLQLQGVLYSHRSNFLHALIVVSKDMIGLDSTSCFCALVPLYHANSWGLVFAAPMMGSRMVLPGQPIPSAMCILAAHRPTCIVVAAP